MGGVREKGVSSVHAAVSVDGVVRIGKSQPFTNEVEWDGEDAMDLLFDVPNAGTDVEVIIYLNENKEVGTNPKSQFFSKTRHLALEWTRARQGQYHRHDLCILKKPKL
jgi:hypothetical protein